jgi:hypothetical protein
MAYIFHTVNKKECPSNRHTIINLLKIDRMVATSLFFVLAQNWEQVRN